MSGSTLAAVIVFCMTALALGLGLPLGLVALTRRDRNTCTGGHYIGCVHGYIGLGLPFCTREFTTVNHRIDEVEDTVDETNDRIDATDENVARLTERIAELEQRQPAVIQVIRNDVRSRFNWLSALIGAGVGVLVGLLFVAFLSGHALTIGGTTYHWGWAMHQAPLDVITIAVFAVFFGALAGFIWDREIENTVVENTAEEETQS
ncbi:MAG TPA: hypothetical protein VHQ86_04245 [Candidatus Saccharimonadia bacterium]|nr:hypothetical protein [Candidatus Saccharimonadia bacterium]